MQHLFPGRYRPSHQSTLQVGLRKIRARLLSIMEEPWSEEVIQASGYVSIAAEAGLQEGEPSIGAVSSPASSVSELQTEAGEEGQQLVAEEEIRCQEGCASGGVTLRSEEGSQQKQYLQVQRLPMTIEGGIHAYFQEQEACGRRSKTLEWHQTALRFFQQYLVHECHLRFVSQITECEVRGWMAFLRSTPSSKGTSRSVTTIATYVRSARAFCRWLLYIGALERSPFVKGTVPKVERKAVRLLEAEAFERLLLACRAGGEGEPSGEWAAARNRAILWVLLDTGIHLSELRKLRLGDVDRERRALRVQSTRGQSAGSCSRPTDGINCCPTWSDIVSQEGVQKRNGAKTCTSSSLRGMSH